MSRVKVLFGVLVFMLMAFPSYSKVCFLGNPDGSARCLDGVYLSFSACPECSYCEAPKRSATACSCDDSYYKPNDCCTSDRCVYPKVCSGGSLCESKLTETADSSTRYQQYCEPSSCVCPADYTYKCDGTGQTGVGTPCVANGVKYYTSCTCADAYHSCTSPAKGSDSAYCDEITDGTTVRKYKTCSCPETYVQNKLDCSEDCSTCTDDDKGTVYRCSRKTANTSCQCGYSDGCQQSCNEASTSYTYIGETPDTSTIDLKAYIYGTNSNESGICIQEACCKTGNWDAAYTLTQNGYATGVAYCEQLGYTETSCSSTKLVCPFSSGRYRCLDL